MPNTKPVAQNVGGTSLEDTPLSITLTSADVEDGSGAEPRFTIQAPPAHGTLWLEPPFPPFSDGVPASVGTSYAPDYFDDSLGAWAKTVYFIPDPDWSGTTSFDYTSTDSAGATSVAATATATIEAVADAPVVHPGAHDLPQDLSGQPIQATATAGNEDSPQVTYIYNGKFIAVWQLGNGNVQGRVFEGNGTPAGAAFDITDAAAPSELRPAVAGIVGGGSYVATWIQGGSGTGGGDIRAVSFNAFSGNFFGFAVATSATGREAAPSIASSVSGFDISWAVESGSTASILVQRYSTSGTAVGTPTTVTTSADHGLSSGTSFDPPKHALAKLQNATVVVWSQNGSVHSRVIHSDGTLGTDVTIESGSNPSVTALAQGFVVTWADDELHAQVFDSNGAAAGAPVTLTDSPFLEQTPVVTGLADGRFVVAWNNGVAGSTDIFAEVFLPDGTPNSGGPIQVTTTGQVSATNPTITRVGLDQFAVGWVQPRASGASNQDVFVRVYDAGPGPVSGLQGKPLDLPTTFALSDQDGSEVLQRIRIEGLPTGFSISDGTQVIGAREGGTADGAWIIDAADASGFLAGLLAGTAHLKVNSTAEYFGNFQLLISATSRETQGAAAGSEEAVSPAVIVPISIAANTPPHAPTLRIEDAYEISAAIVDQAKIAENTDTASPIKLATLFFSDDGAGQNIVSFSGPDAASFEASGNGIYLRAGVVLDYEAKQSYSVRIDIDDPTVGNTPDASLTLTLNVTNVSDVEAGTPVNSTVTIDEDSTYFFTLDDFRYIEPNHTMAAVEIFRPPANGVLWYDATGGDHADAVPAFRTITAAAIAAGKLFFTPDANESGPNYADFGYQLYDSHALSSFGSFSFAVAAVDDAPRWTVPLGDDYEEGDTIPFAHHIAVADPELDALNGGLGDYSFASLTLRRSTGASDDDVFGLDSAASFTVVGNSLQDPGGSSFASFSSSNGTLTVTFGNGSTSALVNEVLQRITYTNTRDDLPDDTVEFTWQLSDGNTGAQGSGGEQVGTATTSLDFRPIDDAPVNTVPEAQSVDAGTDLVFSAANHNAIAVSDVDAGTLDLRVRLDAAHGTLTLAATAGLTNVSGDGTGRVEMTGSLTDLNAALDGLIYRASAGYIGGDSLVIDTDDLGHSGEGEIAASAGVATVYFRPAADFNGDTAFEYAAVDDKGRADASAATVSLSVAARNDTPVLGGDGQITVAEGGTVADLTAADVDGDVLTYTVTGLGHGTLRLSGASALAFTQSELAAGAVSFVHDGGEEPGSIALSLTDGTVTRTAAIVVTVDPHRNDAPVAQDGAAAGDEDTEILGTATANDADDATADLGFRLVGANGGALHGSVSMHADGSFSYAPLADFSGTDSFTFVASDCAGADSNTAAITITVNPVKDLPGGTAGNAALYLENQAPVVIDPTLTVSDPDSIDLMGASVAISAGFAAGQDVLGFVDQNGITGSYDGTTGVLTLSGTASLAHYQAALRAVTYFNSSDDPSTGGRTIIFFANDGGGPASLGSSSVTVSPVNDAPVNSVPATLEIEANTATAIALSVFDADAGSGQIVTTLSVAHGTLTVASGGAAVAGSGTATVTLTGTLAAINATLANNVVYAGAHDYFGTDTLTVATSDSGNTGSGGTLTDTDAVTIHLNTALTGTPGNDSFTALHGNERIDGLGGIDTIRFDFRLVDATVHHAGNMVVIDGPDSHTVLTGFETFVFTDGTVNNADGDVLVDDLFYYAKYHDVWNAHADADAHYHGTGWREGRDPDAFFSTVTYLSANPDVKAAGVDPLRHFDSAGWQEGRLPSITFDPAQYLAANPDVAAAHVDPLAHFLRFGAGEGRQPFAPDALIAANGFDYVYYRQHNPDVAAAGVDPLQHFETVGWREGRNPNALFDVNGYLASYADVAQAGVNPLDHYHQFGWHEGRDPSPAFDTTSYLSGYADVAAAHADPLVHFLTFGMHEGRSPFADGAWG